MLKKEFIRAIEIAKKYSDSLFVPRISREDGVALYTVTYLLGLPREKFVAIDAGAGVGYSTLWIAAALEELCIKSTIYAVERNRDRYNYLMEVIKQLDSRCVEIAPVMKEATTFLNELGDAKVDLAFVDIDKHLYEVFFEKIRDKVNRGGVLAFHNAYWVKEFYENIKRLEYEGIRATIIPTEEGILLVKFP